jgi:hypothetical protein
MIPGWRLELLTGGRGQGIVRGDQRRRNGHEGQCQYDPEPYHGRPAAPKSLQSAMASQALANTQPRRFSHI